MAPRSSSISRTGPPSPCSAVHVLLVDDDETFRNGLAENLRDDGHEVVEYGDPRQVAAVGVPAGMSVAIIDYEMPHMHGFALADELHAARPELPIVLVTAYSPTELVEQTSARGFLRLCRKPIDYDALHALVHRMVEESEGTAG
jgi:DNA-binding NtrC family response regulator